MTAGLVVTAVILIEWLLIIAEISGDWQFYVWAFLVVILAAEAERARSPKQFSNRLKGIAYYAVFFIVLFLLNKSFIYVREIGLPVPGGVQPTPTPS